MMNYQILLLLDQLLPTDLARIIAYISILMTDYFEPRHIVIDADCGHRLGFIVDICKSKFVCPVNNEIYLFAKKQTAKISICVNDKYLSNVTELDIKMHIYHCEICDRSWGFNFRSGAPILQQKLICFCGVAATQFPCGKCSAQKCSESKCINVAELNQFLCRYHLRSHV